MKSLKIKYKNAILRNYNSACKYYIIIYNSKCFNLGLYNTLFHGKHSIFVLQNIIYTSQKLHRHMSL